VNKITLTKEEQKAIKSLQRLANKWPDTLELFSWSGSLHVFKKDDQDYSLVVGSINGIDNGGGDPGDDEVSQDVEIEYE